MIAFLVRSLTRREETGSRAFLLTGTAIWLVAVLWSAETAIYVTAIWLPAMMVRTLQENAVSPARGMLRFAARIAAYPLFALLLAGLAVTALYRLSGRPGPDFMGHLEYVLLYSSGGFGALPIDPTCTVWYLALVF